MTYPLLNCKPISGRWLAITALGCMSLVSACSSDGTTTVLDNGQTLSIDLPEPLISAVDDGTLEEPNIRPVVTLSNGSTVGTTLVAEQVWSGTINLETDTVFTVTVTWVERFLDQDLQLTRRTLDLAVASDGTAQEVDGTRTAYSQEGLDDDNDGITNLAERLSGTDPFVGVEPTPDAGEDEPPAGGFSVAVPVTTRLPDDIVEALIENTLDIDDLRPVVTVSNGDTVDLSPPVGDSDEWTGSFNVTTTGVFQVTIIWVEDFEGADLRLARRTADYAVGGDGRVVLSAGTGFDVDFDDDDDGPSNLQERRNGTDPRVDES